MGSEGLGTDTQYDALKQGRLFWEMIDLHLSQTAVHILINEVTSRFDSDSCLFIFRLFYNTLNCPSYDPWAY